MYTQILILTLTVLVLIVLQHVRVQNRIFPIRVGPSNVHGRGVFATRDIKKGEIIEDAPVVLFDRNEVKPGTILRDYDIRYDDTRHAMMLGYGAIFNHSDNHSANWNFVDDKTIRITANKDIKKDQEIFVNYGTQYWASRSN